MLFEQGIPIRADWYAVVRAVVDAVLGREDIDPDRIVPTGWSLAGHLAPRGPQASRDLPRALPIQGC